MDSVRSQWRSQTVTCHTLLVRMMHNAGSSTGTSRCLGRWHDRCIGQVLTAEDRLKKELFQSAVFDRLAAFQRTALSLARIMHKSSTAAPLSSALMALRFLTLLDVLHEYACGALCRAPCQRSVCGTSLEKPLHNPG